MDDDDLPPQPAPSSDGGFSGELGRTFAMAAGIGVFIAIAAVVLYFVMRATGHSP